MNCCKSGAMPPNTMAKAKLTSARDYFEEVAKPAFEQHFARPSNFQSIYAMVASLYHLHEWVFFYKKAEIQAKYGMAINSRGKFWHQVIEQNVKDAGFIRDLNNVSKHVQLTITNKAKPSTPMHHSANTEISTSGWGVGAYGRGPFGGTRVVKMHAGRKRVSLDPIAKRLFKFWKKLLNDVDPASIPPKVRRVKTLKVTKGLTPSANS